MNRLLLVGFDNSSNGNMIPMVSSRDAKNVDIKIDDGKVLEGIVHGIDVNIGENNNINCIDDNIDYSTGDDKGKCVLAFYEEGVTSDITEYLSSDEIERLSGVEEFKYTGGVQEFVVPKGVKEVMLEVWGGSGAGGGKGGYSQGIMTVTKGQILHIYVGGAANGISAGYNGGGSGSTSYPYGGGGATHIATMPGILSSLEANKDKVLIVAGGGGYANGGGVQGGTNNDCSEGGSQTAGGKSHLSSCPSGTFGQGANGANCKDNGGGGGWYGGGTGCGSAGGSGHIGIGVSGETKMQTKRTGNGVARICCGNRIGECNGTAPDT
jgi:hypothetical protein